MVSLTRARTRFHHGVVLAAALATLGASGSAHAGSLGNVQSSHASSGGSGKSSGSSSSKSSGGGRSRGSGGSFLVELLANIFVSAVQIAVESDARAGDEDEHFDSANDGIALPMVAAAPYAAGQGIYVTHEARTPSRWAEIKASGGAGFNKPIYSFNLDGSVFVGPITLRGGYQRLHEVGVQDVDQLEFARGQLGVNVLSGWGERAELHILGGATGMHGREWTPALDVEVDARVFPVRPLQIRVSAGASMFAQGSPLLRAQFAPGITIGRIDIGVCASWLHQERAIDLVSPGVWLAARL